MNEANVGPKIKSSKKCALSLLEVSSIPPLPLYVLLALDSISISDLNTKPNDFGTNQKDPTDQFGKFQIVRFVYHVRIISNKY